MNEMNEKQRIAKRERDEKIARAEEAYAMATAELKRRMKEQCALAEEEYEARQRIIRLENEIRKELSPTEAQKKTALYKLARTAAWYLINKGISQKTATISLEGHTDMLVSISVEKKPEGANVDFQAAY